MDAVRKALAKEFMDPEARLDYAEEFLNSYIALQIKTLRLQRGWTQGDLADYAGMKQSRISAMEQADYSGWSLRTLRRLAQAFDVALTVQFQSFGHFLEVITSLDRRTLERPSFSEDPAFQPPEPQETSPKTASSQLSSVTSINDFKERRSSIGTTARVAAASKTKIIHAPVGVQHG